MVQLNIQKLFKMKNIFLLLLLSSNAFAANQYQIDKYDIEFNQHIQFETLQEEQQEVENKLNNIKLEREQLERESNLLDSCLNKRLCRIN
jgi:hypothetical protein